MCYQTPVVIKRHPTVYRQTGFTLLELMIVVAIAGIVMAIGVPSFQSITTTNRIAANTNELITALNLARSEAVKRGTDVSVTASGDWDQGWIVYFNDGTDDVVLRVFESLGGNTTLTSDDAVVTYTALGALDDTVEFDLNVESENRCIRINAVGRANAEQGSCE